MRLWWGGGFTGTYGAYSSLRVERELRCKERRMKALRGIRRQSDWGQSRGRGLEEDEGASEAVPCLLCRRRCPR